MNQKNIQAVLRRFTPNISGITSTAMYQDFDFTIKECNEIIHYLIAENIIEPTTFDRGEGFKPFRGWSLKISAEEREKLLLL